MFIIITWDSLKYYECFDTFFTKYSTNMKISFKCIQMQRESRDEIFNILIIGVTEFVSF